MKVKVADLEPNPFRKMGTYPIDRAKVKALKTSITETSFWDNILARPVNGKYQIAYGHHRWVALKELGIKQVDIPVRKLDDATMVRIMAEENLNWRPSPAVINETVLATKEFLEGELAKHKTWRQFNKSIKLVSNESQFQKLKQTGVGQTTILKFLGGNWKQWMIQEALATIKADKAGKVDRKAVERFETIKQARCFRNVVQSRKIDKAKHKSLAEKIVKSGASSRAIEDAIDEIIPPPPEIKRQIQKSKPLPNIIEFLNKCESDADNLNRRLKELRPHLKELVKNPRTLGRLVSALKQLDKTAEKIVTDYEAEKKRKESVICTER